MHPVRAGLIIHIAKGPIELYDRATWFSDNRRLLFTGNEPGRGKRCYVQAIDSTVVTAVTPKGITGTILSPDNRWLLATNLKGAKIRFNIETDESRPVVNLDPADEVIRWDESGRSLYVYRPQSYPIKIFRLDPENGRRDAVLEISPMDLSGIIGNPYVFMTADGKNYVYGLRRYLHDLYLTEGLN